MNSAKPIVVHGLQPSNLWTFLTETDLGMGIHKINHSHFVVHDIWINLVHPNSGCVVQPGWFQTGGKAQWLWSPDLNEHPSSKKWSRTIRYHGYPPVNKSCRVVSIHPTESDCFPGLFVWTSGHICYNPVPIWDDIAMSGQRGWATTYLSEDLESGTIWLWLT